MFNNVFIQDDFLSQIECKKLINFYNSKPLPKSFCETYPLHLENNKLSKKINKLSSTLYNCVIEWFQIVKWPSSHPGKPLHTDFTRSTTVLSSIIYLNNDYKGGHTYFEDGTNFAPLTGRIIFFDGNYYRHGVSPVEKKDRYTLAAWFKR